MRATGGSWASADVGRLAAPAVAGAIIAGASGAGGGGAGASDGAGADESAKALEEMSNAASAQTSLTRSGRSDTRVMIPDVTRYGSGRSMPASL